MRAVAIRSLGRAARRRVGRAVLLSGLGLFAVGCASQGAPAPDPDPFDGFVGGEALTLTIENDFEMAVAVRMQWGVGVDTELLATVDPGRSLDVPLYRDGPTARALIINAGGRRTTSNRIEEVGPDARLRLVIDPNYRAVLRAR